MLATLVRATPGAPAVDKWWRRGHVRWLVPLATAATVAAIWIAIPDQRVDRNQLAVHEDLPEATPSERPQQEEKEAASAARRRPRLLLRRAASTLRPQRPRHRPRSGRQPGLPPPNGLRRPGSARERGGPTVGAEDGASSARRGLGHGGSGRERVVSRAGRRQRTRRPSPKQ